MTSSYHFLILGVSYFSFIIDRNFCWIQTYWIPLFCRWDKDSWSWIIIEGHTTSVQRRGDLNSDLVKEYEKDEKVHSTFYFLPWSVLGLFTYVSSMNGVPESPLRAICVPCLAHLPTECILITTPWINLWMSPFDSNPQLQQMNRHLNKKTPLHSENIQLS